MHALGCNWYSVSYYWNLLVSHPKRTLILLFRNFCSSVGGWYLIVKINDIMPRQISIPPDYVFVVFAVGVVLTFAIISRPQKRCLYRINGRDSSIEVVVGDFFEQDGDFIIGSNDFFDTEISNELISKESIQGQFTLKYYRDNVKTINTLIDHELSNRPNKVVETKFVGKKKRYSIGTTVKIPFDGRVSYWFAMSKLNDSGVASTTYDDFLNSISSLWRFISEKCTKGILVIPLVGTNFGRLVRTREDVAQDIISSYIAESHNSTFCAKLIIVIRPSDVFEHNINISNIFSFLEYKCKFSEFVKDSGRGVGSIP